MRAYPFGIPPLVDTVTSASFAISASFITATVNTASIASNLLGPSGSVGSDVTITGIQGVQGITGPSGSKGLGAYLLSSSLATCV
jgi:hypothetical protein